ncbi:MAG TPA: ABC transporter permease subunit [Pseudolabrys sp.]|nr:ABC transporter permease subunit [Pseudolabrys sp.]
MSIRRAAVVGLPFGWLLLFVLAPVIVVLAISFAESRIGAPPFTPPLLWQDGALHFSITLDNYLRLFTDRLYADAFLSSIRIAAVSAFITLLIAYPMAYGIARAGERARPSLLMLVVLPFWTSFLIRVYAWTGLLNSNGLINKMLLNLGIVDHPLPLLHTEFAVHLGIVYSYLPFMVLPIYGVLERMDWTLLEAAADLGARPLRSFFRVTLPLSMPGVIAGLLLVFIPALGEFIIPELLGGPDTLMVGRVLWTEFFSNHDWPFASALAVVMLIAVLLPAALIYRVARRGELAA